MILLNYMLFYNKIFLVIPMIIPCCIWLVKVEYKFEKC